MFRTGQLRLLVVGTEQELERVRSFLSEGGGALVLEGEAGIGKSTVWRVAVESARESAMEVFGASCAYKRDPSRQRFSCKSP